MIGQECRVRGQVVFMSAIAGDAIIHLLCPMSDLRHVLVWHTGGLVLFMLAGWCIGRMWEHFRWRR